MAGRKLLGQLVLVVALLAAGEVLAFAPPASAATGTVYLRGTVTCPTDNKFVGAWVNNSTGKSAFASKSILPGTDGRQAYLTLTLSSVKVPTTVSLNVGCGGSTSNWKYVFNGVGAVKATAGGTVFINVGCSTSSCSRAPKGVAGSTTTNPGYNSLQCTWRAAAFWKQMTGSYPSWGGDAGYWDNNAPGKDWGVRSWPEPDSLMVTQPTSTNAAGHVLYVAQLRVSNGKTQVKIYDRNNDAAGGDRNGVWIGIPSGTKFIRVPPRFTTHNR